MGGHFHSASSLGGRGISDIHRTTVILSHSVSGVTDQPSAMPGSQDEPGGYHVGNPAQISVRSRARLSDRISIGQRHRRLGRQGGSDYGSGGGCDSHQIGSRLKNPTFRKMEATMNVLKAAIVGLALISGHTLSRSSGINDPSLRVAPSDPWPR